MMSTWLSTTTVSSDRPGTTCSALTTRLLPGSTITDAFAVYLVSIMKPPSVARPVTTDHDRRISRRRRRRMLSSSAIGNPSSAAGGAMEYKPGS